MPPTRPRKKKPGPNDVVIQYGDGSEKIMKNGMLPPEPELTLADKVDKLRRTPQHKSDVAKDVKRRVAQMVGKQIVEDYEKSQEKIPDFSVHCDNFFDELKKPKSERRYAVNKLAGEGHIISMPSPRKTGKTTLLANLGFAGLTGTKFLDSFSTDLQDDEGLAVINAEMISDDYRDVWDALNPGEMEGQFPFKRLHMMHCRETGTKINLLSDRARDSFAEWLIDRNVRWLFLDPWKEFVTWSHIDPIKDKDVNELLEAVKDLSYTVGLTMTMIPSHTPQSAEAGIRAKNSGAFEDGVDAIWAYYRPGKIRERGSTRVFGVEGRIEGLDHTEVIFDREHMYLTLGSRTVSQIISEERQDARDIAGLTSIKASPTQDAISDVLDEPMTPSQIAEATGLDVQKVKDALGRGKGKRFIQGGDGTWKRK